MIEDKDTEINIMKERCDVIRNENYDYQKQVNESLNAFQESKEIYEKRIRELSHIVFCL